MPIQRNYFSRLTLLLLSIVILSGCFQATEETRLKAAAVEYLCSGYLDQCSEKKLSQAECEKKAEEIYRKHGFTEMQEMQAVSKRVKDKNPKIEDDITAEAKKKCNWELQVNWNGYQF